MCRQKPIILTTLLCWIIAAVWANEAEGQGYADLRAQAAKDAACVCGSAVDCEDYLEDKLLVVFVGLVDLASEDPTPGALRSQESVRVALVEADSDSWPRHSSMVHCPRLIVPKQALCGEGWPKPTCPATPCPEDWNLGDDWRCLSLSGKDLSLPDKDGAGDVKMHRTGDDCSLSNIPLGDQVAPGSRLKSRVFQTHLMRKRVSIGSVTLGEGDLFASELFEGLYSFRDGGTFRPVAASFTASVPVQGDRVIFERGPLSNDWVLRKSDAPLVVFVANLPCDWVGGSHFELHMNLREDVAEADKRGPVAEVEGDAEPSLSSIHEQAAYAILLHDPQCSPMDNKYP